MSNRGFADHRVDGYDYQGRQSERVLKLVITGDPKVGKTSLRRVFMGKAFKQNYLPTLGADFSLFTMDYSFQRIKCTLWDLSGQPKFSHVSPQYYIGAHGAIILYDVHTEDPVTNLINWIDTYLEYSGRFNTPILVIQNKIDLINPQNQAELAQAHSKLIEQLNIYYQDKLTIQGSRTSAKTGENVNSSLEQYIRDVVDYYDSQLYPPVKSKFSERSISHVKAAYFITFENLIGPLIVARSPISENLEYSNQEESSVVHLSAGLNMEDLVERQYETSTFLWTDPISLMYYIAFVYPNEEARGSYDLYMVGCNVSRDLKNVLGDEQSMIDGYLHNSMNKIVSFMNSHDYTLSQTDDIFRLHQSVEDSYQVNEILHELRLDIDDLIRKKLQG